MGQGGWCFVLCFLVLGECYSLVFFFTSRYLMNVQELLFSLMSFNRFSLLAQLMLSLLDLRWEGGFGFLNKTRRKFWLLAVCFKDATVCQIQPNLFLSLDFKCFNLFISNFKNCLSFIMPQTFWIKLSEACCWWLKLQTAVHPGHWAESHYQVVLFVAQCSYLFLMHAVIYFYERFPFSAISGNVRNNVIVNVCKY